MGIWRQLFAQNGRDLELDGVRGLAILLVVIGHAIGGVAPHYHSLFSLDYQSSAGLTGVQLFFVLSGFLITRNITTELASGRFRLRVFYFRRAARLYPALIVATLVAAAYWLWTGIKASAVSSEVVRTLTYSNNLPFLWSWWPSASFMPHAWSLAVEEQFYLVWPLLIMILKTRRRQIVAAGVVAVIMVVTRMHPAIPDGLDYRLLRWDALMAGALMALTPLRLAPAVIVAGSVAFAVLTMMPSGDYGTATYAVAALSACCVLAARGKWSTHPVLVVLGRISYGLYLWHMVLLRPGLSPVVGVGLAIVFAVVSFVFIEDPVVSWSRRVLTKQSI